MENAYRDRLKTMENLCELALDKLYLLVPGWYWQLRLPLAVRRIHASIDRQVAEYTGERR
jgi:hypothetical protein